MTDVQAPLLPIAGVILAGGQGRRMGGVDKALVDYEGRPLLEDYLGDALSILEQWREEHDSLGDYYAAREALEKGEELQLCGGIYYADGQPAAYTLGEELACGSSFVIHFEKALNRYKGLYQFVNQAFASIIGDNYATINREQDLGQEGLRHAKLSYRPVGFVEKFLAMPMSSSPVEAIPQADSGTAPQRAQ